MPCELLIFRSVLDHVDCNLNRYAIGFGFAAHFQCLEFFNRSGCVAAYIGGFFEVPCFYVPLVILLNFALSA